MFNKEKIILKLLARGISYAEICERLNMSKYALHNRCNQIRRKTGIKSTKDAKECKSYLYANLDTITLGGIKLKAKDPERPSQAQLKVMLSYTKLGSVAAVATDLSLAIGTVNNALSGGTRKAVIRRERCREYLESIGVLKPVSPMDDPMFN